MDQTIKDAWLVALRSGDYEQGQCQLRSPENKFCCLGVLSDVLSKDNPEIQWIKTFDYFRISDGEFGSAEVLTQNIANKAGLTELDPIVNIIPTDKRCAPVEQIKLSTLNDTGKTFDQIADLIEAQL
jgi:hypothetical protein